MLLVEDQAATADALRRLLEREHFAVTVAPDGESARRALPARSWALVLVDVHLPDGSGLDLVKAVRDAVGPGVAVVVISGDTSLDTLAALEAVRADYFLAKPLNASGLMELLGRLRKAG